MADQLIRKRGAVKSKLTSFKNYLSALSNNLQDGVLDAPSFIELEQRLERFQRILDEFDQAHLAVLLAAEEDALDAHERERALFESGYFAAVGTARDLLNKNTPGVAGQQQPVLLNAPVAQANLNADAVSVAASQNSAEQINVQGVKLPTIQLPKFDGKYEDWLEYRDTFESLIHNNAVIHSIQKFHYLRASLAAGAAQVIKSLEFSAANYQVAWDALCDRYDNKRLLLNNHVRALFSVEGVPKESANQLRKTVDSVNKHLRALESLDQPTDQWDTLLIYLIVSKLDSVTVREWEQKRTDVPKLSELIAFLKKRADLLETLDVNRGERRSSKSADSRSLVIAKEVCCFCSGDHIIQDCGEFLKLGVDERLERVKALKLCVNCLKRGHMSHNCFRKWGSCKKCRGRHHNLLHINNAKAKVEASETSETEGSNPSASSSAHVTMASVSESSMVLLTTALVDVVGSDLKRYKARVLLDAGSQSSFISEGFSKLLNVPRTPTNMKISGFGQSSSNASHRCRVEILSRVNNFKTQVSCFIAPTITGVLPNFTLDRTKFKIPSNIQLADPAFYKPAKVDMLLGADCFWNLLCVGQVKCGTVGPYLQKTRLGWVLGGPIELRCESPYQLCHFVSTENHIDAKLTKFWEIEDFPLRKEWSNEEKACEEHFVRTTERDVDGRFVVSFPLKESPSKLGDSREMAEKRFQSLERKLVKDESLYKRYASFMAEYQDLGHMRAVCDVGNEPSYYMPHHAVLKEDSTTTKLRVVFDASALSSSGWSLNQIQMVGPTIQDDLFSILLRFRKHRYVIGGDVEKMYRQVLVKPEDRRLQRILWRDDPSKPIDTFEMLTVTYGQAASSFLAIRSLQQAAKEYEAEYPSAVRVIKSDFYVDDLLTGANSVAEAADLGEKINFVLSKSHFNLRKWVSNEPAITKRLSDAEVSDFVRMGSGENSKTLGLFWEIASDSLLYRISTSKYKKVTKRTILSDISQIFDPLGLLSPCIVTAKVILQKIWLEKVGWDDSLPFDLHTQWLVYRDELEALSELRIKRVSFSHEAVESQIHGFSDASEKAYGAAVYVTTIDSEGTRKCRLLCAKSKVAPLKTVTIPRLELCGALMLAKLVQKVRNALNVGEVKCTYWTDSTVVLGWLRMSPHLLQTFTANRASEIQRLTNIDDWRHVPTTDNPADYISRGVKPPLLSSTNIWWSGPSWLLSDESYWPSAELNDAPLPELRKLTSVLTTGVAEESIFERYGSLGKLERIVAYCLRFIKNCTRRVGRASGVLNVGELRNARDLLTKLAQKDSFGPEISFLKNGKTLNNKNGLLCLNAFLDEQDVLRVGGRLTNSEFEYKKKHPALISGKHAFTRLLFKQEHVRLLHAGPQQLLSSIREQFWPLKGRSLARKTVHDCVSCFRVNPRFRNPLMGNLPVQRVAPAPPFFRVGVDFAGPLLLRSSKVRRASKVKGYIALFVCFCTKAIHLEIVHDLTSEAFIAALRRFCARRGKPHEIFSDNGTNFIGAESELRELGKFIKKNERDLTEFAENIGLKWHFVPPSCPHFGGLWEAGVKATKLHLKRVMCNACLTFEQLNTLLCQIEAVLNSRPMHPISNDPNDLTALCPAHFLIGRPLTSLADPELVHVPDNRLSHWQHIQKLHQHFWSRWSKDYISELQHRRKWRTHQPPHRVGDLVLIKDDNQPPLKWRLGRITQLHPGSDGVSRVASLKTENGDLKRPVVKLCILPSANVSGDQ